MLVIEFQDFEKIESHLKAKEYFLALDICEKILSNHLIQDVDKIYFFLARIYFNLEDYSLSKKYLLKINRKELQTARFYFLLGRIEEKQKNDACDSLYMAVYKNPQNEKYLNKYIQYMIKNNKLEKLLESLLFIVDSGKNKYFYVECSIVDVLIKLNILDQALSRLEKIDFSQCVDLDKMNELLGDIYWNQGQKELAVKYYNLILNKRNEVILKIIDLSLDHDGNLGCSIFDLYNFSFQNKSTKNIVIVFSPIKSKFILERYDFKTSVLFVSENIYTYYTLGCDYLVNYLVDFIGENYIDTVTLMGSSKGSFAAINIGWQLSKKIGAKRVKVVAFSPQTLLFPMNMNINNLPSYKSLIKISKSHNCVDYYLKKFGCLSKISENIQISIIYGALNQKDAAEAQRLQNIQSVKLMPIPDYPFHTSLLLYSKKGDSLKKAFTQKIHSKNKDDEFFRPENNEKLIQSFLCKLETMNYDLHDVL